MKKALVCGAGGFIGHHLVNKLKDESTFVRGVDLKYPEYNETTADDFVLGDLRDISFCRYVVDQKFDEVYQLAADTRGEGIGYCGNKDADIMGNSAIINLNILEACRKRNVKKIFFSSSDCSFLEANVSDKRILFHQWEKLFSEKLYLAYAEKYGMDIHIARYVNIYGRECNLFNEKETIIVDKMRKMAEAQKDGEVKLRVSDDEYYSFLYIDDCINGTLKIMRSNFTGPVYLESEEIISTKILAEKINDLSRKNLRIEIIKTNPFIPVRKPDNSFCEEKINWRSGKLLERGLLTVFSWVSSQIRAVVSEKK